MTDYKKVKQTCLLDLSFFLSNKQENKRSLFNKDLLFYTIKRLVFSLLLSLELLNQLVLNVHGHEFVA